uniref:Transcription elongation factor SPT6 n=1 Tax=Megaselia scalaris TaxID=36166 RepID=T1GUP5_MEGSC
MLPKDMSNNISTKESERRSTHSHREEAAERFEDEEGDSESDADDFIVDDEGRPIAEKKKKKKHIFANASLQEGQDIFGVDFDYDEFAKYDEDEYEDESEGEDDYEEDGEGERERRPKKSSKKKAAKKSIFEIYEPSELKRGHFTDLDNEIRKTDIPERMQTREVPVTPVPEGSRELEEEAEWIYKQAFCKSSTIGKIKQALDFMRNQQLEVPFIAFYRKEYVQPELTIKDLWRVYEFDGKWCQLLARKNKMLVLFEKMRNYQLDQIMKNPDAPIPEDVRIIKDDDIDRLKRVQTPEELKDVHMHFLLYYSSDIPQMQEEFKRKDKEKKRLEKAEERRKLLESLEEGQEPPPEEIEDEEMEDEDGREDQLKQARDSGPYAMCRKAGILEMAKRFGLSPEQFAENLRENYQRHDVEQEAVEPADVAKKFLCPKFMMVDEVLHAAKFVVARQISKEPLLRKCVREIYFERAKINVKPTKKGSKEIDENHFCYSMKYLKEKPIRDLVNDQYLKLHMAEEDKLIEMTFLDNIEDEFSKNVQDWNALRAECVELAIVKMVLPEIKKELKTALLLEAKEFILKACSRKLYNWIKIAPYAPDFQEEDDYEWDTSKGIRAMGLAFVPDFAQAAFCAITSIEGDVTDYLRLPNILKKKNSYRKEDKEEKLADLLSLKTFIKNKKPHVIAIGGESREAQMIQHDIRDIVKELIEEEQFPSIGVEIIDNELAKIYANSNKAAHDFREYPPTLKEAVSLARRIQDPLIEYSQLCNADEEILCLRYHSLQEQLPKEELLNALYLEFINRTNEVGVDINLAVQNSLTVNLVQFICAIGKQDAIGYILSYGPKVFINCSGFIKIDTNSLGDSTEAYVEVLDGSRVHPETYEWARKMAVDALEYDDEEANPAGALEEILESPERLKDLDLDAFAVELERQGFGNKSITLYDIRAELNSRYKDLRTPFKSANAEEMFDMLTKETPESFYVGKMVLATVVGLSYRKPQGEQLDNANPVRNEETGHWQCPFCLKDDFPELADVWNHFDAGDCPGQATGVKVRLDNGLLGFIHIKNLSDKHVKNPEERVQIGMAIHVRIIKIEVERFQVDCSSKSSDLMDKNHEGVQGKIISMTKNRKIRTIERKMTPKRINQGNIVKIMEDMDQGEVVVRPSSKGSDHLTVTWKVTTDVYAHIDVREEGKENAFTLGQSLLIGNEEFEDLDEIIARHVNPMASFARDICQYKYYKPEGDGVKEKMEEILKEEKKKDPKKIHYFVSASKTLPGKFLLSYLPKNKCRHEYVTVTPEGFRFRGQVFDSLNTFLKWFKEHFSDPLPGGTPVSTPRSSSALPGASSRTPSYGGTPMNSDVIHKVAQNMPSHMLHSLSQSMGQTPHYGTTPGYGQGQSAYVNTPYTPSGQTPFMTPYHTPHSSQTPRYGQSTPRHHMNSNSSVHSSPSSYGRSPRVGGPPPGGRGGYGGQQESMDWQKASDAWANRRKPPPNRGGHGGPPGHHRGPPPNPSPRYDEYSQSRKTPQYDNRHLPSKSPRSVRSTPRTNTSPHSMMTGDATPLYDEN